MVAVDLAVRDDEDVVAGAHRVLGLRAQRGEARFDAFVAPADRVADVELVRLELAAGVRLDVAQLLHLVEVEHRLRHSRRIGGLVSSMPSRFGLGPMKRHQRHHQLFADRVDRRVGHLREELLEVAVQRSCACSTAPPAASRCPSSRSASSPVSRHRRHDELEVFLRCSRRPAGGRAARHRATCSGGRLLGVSISSSLMRMRSIHSA